jgi:hypothetical protein
LPGVARTKQRSNLAERAIPDSELALIFWTSSLTGSEFALTTMDHKRPVGSISSCSTWTMTSRPSSRVPAEFLGPLIELSYGATGMGQNERTVFRAPSLGGTVLSPRPN